MRIGFAALAILVVTHSTVAFAELTERDIAMSLRDNVVTIRAHWKDQQVHQGFGWIVGEGDGFAYIVTADHVVRGSLPGESAGRLEVTLFGETGLPREGELLPHHDAALDLAIIRMKLPRRRLWRFSSMDVEVPQVNAAISFVGQKNRWFVPEDPGRVSSAKGHEIVVTGLPVFVGTSGAPAVSKGGVLGMIGSDSGADVRVLAVSTIKEKVDSWGYPWMLVHYERAIEISGTWGSRSPLVPTNINVHFEPRDAAHLRYMIEMPANPRESEGVGVIDGAELRIWGVRSSGEESFGILRVIGADESVEPPLALFIIGYVKNGEREPTQVRLARLGADGQDDPRASAFMKQNETYVETVAKALEEMNVGRDEGSSDDASPVTQRPVRLIDHAAESRMPAGLPPDSAKGLQANLLAQMQAVVGALGMTSVELSVTDECIQATGQVPSAWHKEQLGDMLVGMTEGLGQQFGVKLTSCDQTTLP